MSVASKTKIKRCTTVVLGLLVVLSALPTRANTSPGLATTVREPVVSTQWTEDLSLLRTLLKERFVWLWTELRNVVTRSSSSSELFHESASDDISLVEGIRSPVIFGQDFFVDIEDDPYRSYINRLATYGVLHTSSRFYPQNYFRVDDFSSLLARLYQKRFGKSLDFTLLEWLNTNSSFMTKWALQQIIRSLDLSSITIQWNPYDKLMRSEWAYYLVRFFDIPGLSFDTISLSLDLPNYFDDIVGHPFAYSINILADLDIVSTQSSNFYPDNYLRHYDCVVMLVNALLAFESKSLPSILVSRFADVPTTISYYPHVAYAADRWLIDILITHMHGQLRFSPNTFITKHHVYQILNKALDSDRVYNLSITEQQKITRGEFSHLLVEYMWLESLVSSEVSSDDDVVSILDKLKILLSML